jgi:PST family polysaccharide transporter
MATLTFIFIVSSRIIATILALLHIGVAGVLIGYVTGSFIALTAAINFLRDKLPKTTENIPLKPLLYFSLPIFFSSLTLLVLNWADVVIITSLTGDYSLTGVYYIVINSVGILSILYIPMTTTIFPALSAQHGLKNPESISNIQRTASRYILYIIFPSCLGLAIIAPTALTFFYGATYTKGAIPLALLSIATIIMALNSLFTTTLTAIGKTGQILKINAISAVSAVLMLVALVPFFEAVGAAFARLTTQIISLVLATYLLGKEIKMQLDKEALWKSAVASTATVPFLLALELIISAKLSTTQTLVIEILTAAGIYVFSLYILKALKSQDFELLRQALPKPLAKYLNILEGIIVR